MCKGSEVQRRPVYTRDAGEAVITVMVQARDDVGLDQAGECRRRQVGALQNYLGEGIIHLFLKVTLKQRTS